MTKKIETVLLVDDSEIEHSVMRYLLEDYGQSINLLSAYDGEEALELLDSLKKQPDIIFLDINMPRMDGYGFLEEYGRRGLEAAVMVMLTSSDQSRDKDRCKSYDFVRDYIVKPIELEDFAKIIQMV